MLVLFKDGNEQLGGDRRELAWSPVAKEECHLFLGSSPHPCTASHGKGRDLGPGAMGSPIYLTPVDPVFPVTGPVLKYIVVLVTIWAKPDQSFSQDWVKLFLGARDISGKREAKRTRKVHLPLEPRFCDYKSSSHGQSYPWAVLSFLKKQLEGLSWWRSG